MPIPTVLVLTCSEYGQANVQLATSYELALAGVNVCIASFAPLAARVSQLQERVARDATHSGGTPIGSLTFREMKGITPQWEALAKNGVDDAKLPHPCGISGALRCYSTVADAVFYPWSEEEHLAAIERVKETVTEIKPDLTVIDALLLPAIDACRIAGQKFLVLFPNSVKDVAVKQQPGLATFWKYPAVASGFPFPLRWWQIPLNIYLNIRLIMHVVTSVKIKRFLAVRKSLGLTALWGYDMYCGVTYICPALPEIEYPFAFVPEELRLCGPIILPFDPLEEKDPTLMKWLDKRPTVMVNLGSHVVSNADHAREMANAFRTLLDHHDRKGTGGIQVLWKVRANGDIQNAINEVIEMEIENGRVKVVAWLDVDPISILQHPNMVCTVHHGGANSFYEGVWSGVPQVVLPVWVDTYDYASRVEFLDIGVFGSKTSAPGVQAEEFSKSLIMVTGDGEEASKIKSSAKRLKEICRAKGSGRKLASEEILKELGVTE